MLADGGNVLVPIDMGHAQAMTTIPTDACIRVGPQVPPATMNGTRQRPPDPDITGGYQIPIRLTLASNGAVAFARQRIHCNLPDAPVDVARAYESMYQNNQNPTLDEVDAQFGTATSVLAPIATGPALHASAGTSVTLTARWSADSVETYVLVDPATRMLATRSEQMEVTWFTNGGSFAHDRTGPDATLATGWASTNTLEIDAGRTDPVIVWVVLRDDRGGTDVHTYAVSTQ
jgi:hypothetical protein